MAGKTKSGSAVATGTTVGAFRNPESGVTGPSI